ncbi:biotin--[acetyl-CoA-carboxylase] ligase [Novosphingobium taihuense]|uniref:biotin--[biotin carboxyl-carrier protein] ligase n=1 Tax=Novosphingobium taihuense TaxID=260085 RepID=A0A7W7A8X9_9SPHN|nr:biotin--[acetyl-CoA-carboxylase] ligase [Novosphingobium taihuense]MBB4612593.1 BirA family biotin operon repressor/biotin-[acetyl-CoA-carboxylase] ligase [Novosphingobium taihuense]TWH88055.1 BirA family biotin operon repressor/biotin-[acetyl-CoA-carboxylase] ligase [Novosphingobium taihuense]
MIQTVAEISSTNGALLARLGGGEALREGDWLVADRQTAGRGRAGRVWSDGYGNFMGSTAVQLRASDPLPQTLALVAGVAVHETVRGIAPGLSDLRLKWPNDVLVGEAKLAGILLERHGDAVVVGIGVNLAQAPEVRDRVTASLSVLGHPVSRDAFAADLAARFRDAVDRWHFGEWPLLRQQWIARALPTGTLVSVKDSEQGTIIGAFGGIDENGVALLRLADGAVRAIHAGDIEMVGSHASGG